MGLNDFTGLTDLHIDVLREIGNIGSGNAASSLSQMMDRPVDIAIPSVAILDVNDAIANMGGAELQIVGLLLSLSGDVNGMMMFLLEREFACMLLNALMFMDVKDFSEIDEMGYSAIQEMSNIMAASFVNAIADMTGLAIDLSPPSTATDMLGAIMNAPAIYYSNISDKIIFIKNEFGTADMKAPAHIIMMPDVESLNKILEKLGIDTI